MSYLHSRHFTLEESNELLDDIKPLVEEMIRLKHKLDAKGFDVYTHMYFGGSGPNGKGAYPDEMEQLVDIVRNISAEGIVIKEIGRGLIDFPHIRNNGEEVYLCWHFGEGEIRFWHTIPDGFAGRRAINEL
jgi:hypothetical protein